MTSSTQPGLIEQCLDIARSDFRRSIPAHTLDTVAEAAATLSSQVRLIEAVGKALETIQSRARQAEVYAGGRRAKLNATECFAVIAEDAREALALITKESGNVD